MTCGWHMCLQTMCVWHTRLWMMFRTTFLPADNVWTMFRTTYVICQPNLQQSLTLMSSAHCLHIIRTSSARDFSSQTISSQRAETALLMNTSSAIIDPGYNVPSPTKDPFTNQSLAKYQNYSLLLVSSSSLYFNYTLLHNDDVFQYIFGI